MSYGKNVKYNKLVRDKIPEIIAGNDDLEIETKVLSREEAITELKKKIVEEGEELISSNKLDDIKDELADIQEIIYALERETGIKREEVEEIRKTKAKKRGGFEKRTFLIETKGKK